MKRFTFTLEAVRRLREREEQLVQQELADALAERARLQSLLDASKDAEMQTYNYVRATSMQASGLHNVARYDELHRQRIVDATVQLRFKDDAIIRIRERLTDARARREALEKLRERQQREHVAAMHAEEARELDELATVRHLRRNSGWEVGVAA